MTDNDNFCSMDDLNPGMATLGTMIRAAGQYTANKGKVQLEGVTLTWTRSGGKCRY